MSVVESDVELPEFLKWMRVIVATGDGADGDIAISLRAADADALKRSIWSVLTAASVYTAVTGGSQVSNHVVEITPRQMNALRFNERGTFIEPHITICEKDREKIIENPDYRSARFEIGIVKPPMPMLYRIKMHEQHGATIYRRPLAADWKSGAEYCVLDRKTKSVEVVP